MSYRWGIFAAAAIVLGGSAWYFGRPQKQKEEVFPSDYGLGPRAQLETPHEPPPKVIEVIDLARAYEPVREPERPMAGGVDPASFIEERTAPARIPPGKVYEEDDPFADIIRSLPEAWTSNLLLDELRSRQRNRMLPWEVSETKPVRLDVMPREVITIQGDLLNFVPTPLDGTGELKFVPNNPLRP
jgi:hypothetical protein